MNYLRKNYLEKKFYHVGPPRDFDLFLDFKKNKTNDIKESSYLLCTGLFEEQGVDLNYYNELFKDHINKKMICTNPDLIVDRGEKRELCAGSVALVFEKMGGEVIYFGKPFPEVYNQAINNEGKRVLSIGDNLNTDIKGANLLNFNSLIISNGVHRNEIKKEGQKVVITHHLPSEHCNADEFKGSNLNEAFCVEKTEFILNSNVDYWIYGHSHRNKDDFKIGNTKMVTNQLGYAEWGEHKTFDYEKIIEV